MSKVTTSSPVTSVMRSEPPPGLLKRLRQLSGYTWDESREPFHSSYDIWHIFGTKHLADSTSPSPSSSSPTSKGARPPYSSIRPSNNTQDGGDITKDSHNVGRADAPVVARISVHVLREERAYHICKALAQTVDPNRHHIVRPLAKLRLPGQGEDGPISICIFEDPGPNYLSRVVDYGPAWFYFHAQGDGIHGYPNRKFEPESMSLQTFLDFAIGAAECIEVLHGQQIVHGEVRGDAFHMNAELGRVTLINIGPGRLRTFEHGMTSTGWSTMSNELGAKTKLSCMSPEQTGRMPLEPDSRTDIFSLGVLLWTALSQRSAFEGETPLDIIHAVLGQRLPLISDIRLDIPEVVGRIIQKATAKTVWDRYHSVSGLRYDLVEVRRLLGLGDSSQLSQWEIATKDVSPSFILPQAMVGRASEHDTIVRVIDHAFKIRQASQRQDKHVTPQLSRLSEDRFATFDVATTAGDASFKDGNESSTDSTAHQLSISDAITEAPRAYGANTGNSRSRTNSSHESINISSPSPPDPNARLSNKRTSRSLGSRSIDSINGSGDGSISGSDGTGGMILIPNNIGIRANGRCEVITIAGAAGLGKSRLVQSVQVEARQRGFFASSKFGHKTQTENKPFQSVLNLLSNLFQQVLSESKIDPIFYHVLKGRVTPVWPMLHKKLGLPATLFGPKLPVQTASQSSRYNDSLGSEIRRRDSSPKSTSSPGGLPHKIGSQSSHNFLIAGSSTQSVSLVKIILDTLRIFARYKFICLCLDDLHLADEESLELISQIISTRIKMVIIVAYSREHSLSDTMKRILDSLHGEVNTATGDFGVTSIMIKPLSESDTMEYVATTLRRSKSEILPLGAIVHSKAAGNPFYIKEMLNACYRKKCIWYDFRESSWQFDNSSVLKHFDTEDYNGAPHEGLVISRLSELPPATKAILAWASMLGSSFSFQLIQRLLSGECTPPKLLYSEHDSVKGLQAAIQAHIVLPTQDDDIFLFAHDRYILAAASLQKDDENLMHFVMAQTLVKYYPSDENYRNIAASSICHSTSIIKSSVANRKTFRRVLTDSARSFCESGARPAAVKVYASCIELLQDNMWNSNADDVSYDETLQIYTGAAECYLYCGQYQDARRLLLSVSSNAKTAVDKAPAWILQSRASAQEGDSTSAFQALKKTLVALQIKVDDDPTFPKCDAEFKRLSQEIQSSDMAAIVREPKVEDDSVLAAVGAVLAEASGAAFWSDTLFFYQMTLIMVDTYLTLGGFPQAGLGFLQLALIAITRHNMINLADDCGKIALALIERWEDPYTIGRAGTLYPTFLGHIQHPLHATIGQLEGALESAVQAGDRISTILNIGFVGNLKFFASENLAELESYSTYACQDIPNWQLDTPGGTMIIAIYQICRALQGKTHTMNPSVGVMSDAQHNSLKYKSWLINTVKNSDRPLMLYESIEIAPLFLYGHYASAIMLGNSCLKKINAIWSARNTRFLMFFHALALAGSIWIRVQEQIDTEYRRQSPQLSSDVGGRSLEASLQEEMAGLAMLIKYFNRRIEQWQAVTDVNYLTWSKMLAAQIAEMEDDHTAALRCYEEAIDHASTHNFVFEEALANQLLGGHLLRLGSRRLARTAFHESIALYRQFGATGVASHIEQEYYLILQASRTIPLTAEIGIQTEPDQKLEIMQPHASFGYGSSQIVVEDRIGMWQEGSALVDTGAGSALHMLDLTSILESSQVLSSVLQVDQLLKTMCEIILENCKGVASLVAVVVENPSIGWVIAASGCPEEGAEAHSPAIPVENSALIAENVVNYCSRVEEAMCLPNLMEDTRFSNVSGTWLTRNPDSKSVIVIPIRHGNNDKPLIGVLYLEGHPHALTNRNLEVLQLLVNQIGISYSNSLTLKEVERVSAINKSMVEVQKKALAEAIEARNNATIAEAEAIRSAKLAEKADRAKTTFLANISHELRTPLNGVIGNSELLLFDNQLQEHQAEMADSIRISASLLLRLINDILDFAKIEANEMQLHPTVFGIHELVQELVRSIPTPRKQNSPQVQIVQDFHLDHSLVYGDPIRLHQILGNLVSNSLKFTSKGFITIGAKTDWETESETHLTFWTQDTGIGIPAEQLHKLFKPFSQADTSTSRVYGGSGLGLSICKSLVESMGGTINLQSTENVGTTVSFSLTLPKAKPEVSMGIAPIKSGDLHTLSIAEQTTVGFSSFSDMPQSQIRVCIAEDNFINQKIAIQFLEKLKFRHVDAYNNGLEAVEGIRKMAREGRPYHMILMDVQMPILDGYEATKLLRRDSIDAVKGILVIALTASAVQGDREKCLASGMNDYMAKPVRLAMLQKKFSEYMRVQ